MTSAAVERTFALTRIGTGDYICPSNDQKTWWRFQRYTDGRIHGLCVDYEARTFWRALNCPAFDDDEGFGPLFDDLPWREVAQWLPTRRAAIQLMLDDSAE
jgi:hypothetical protein